MASLGHPVVVVVGVKDPDKSSLVLLSFQTLNSTQLLSPISYALASRPAQQPPAVSSETLCMTTYLPP